MLFFIFIITTLQSLLLPQIGSIYSKTITIPLIGKQYIETEMISKNRAKVIFKGLLNEEGQAVYIIKNNKTNIKLNNYLDNLLKSIKCQFSDINYNKNKDEIEFNLFIKPILYKKKIILEKNIIFT